MFYICVQNGIETTVSATVAVHETLLRNRKNVWVQLAGHPGECFLLVAHDYHDDNTLCLRKKRHTFYICATLC